MTDKKIERKEAACLGIVLVLIISFVQPVRADEETEALRKQIKLLEARLDALERKEETVTTGTETARLAKKTPDIEYVPGRGLLFASPDKAFQLRMAAYFQADDHTFLGSSNPANNTDQFFLRSARPVIEAKLYDKFSARLMMDFGNSQTQLLDAYGDYHAADAFNIRIGKFKDPIGIERWQSERNVLFVERGMTTNLVPYRDNGVGIYGDLIPKTLEYQVALTNGSPDLVNGNNGTDNDHSVTARVFTHPFHDSGIQPLQGIGAGVAGSYGNRSGSGSNTEVTSGYVTPAQSKFFTYITGATAATTAFASGPQWRVNPQVTYYNGPFSILSEFVLENQGMRLGSTYKKLQNSAWMLTSAYVLSGEDASFTGVVPRHNFDIAHDQWGAFELAGRFSKLQVDNAAFPTFANIAISAKSAQETTLGGTWYLNPDIKFTFDYEWTTFTGGALTGDRPTEKAILARTQVNF